MDLNQYIFITKRLGFRNWRHSDIKEFAKINADSEVMEHFPNTLSEKETENFIERQKKSYQERGYNYFATEILETGELIGFIGLAYQTYEAEFTPAVDIGWRLKKISLGQGICNRRSYEMFGLCF